MASSPLKLPVLNQTHFFLRSIAFLLKKLYIIKSQGNIHKGRIMRRYQKGAGITEYIIIIAIVAAAALTVIGVFSDRIRTMIAGAVSSVSEEESRHSNAAKAFSDDKSIHYIENLDEDGIATDTPYYTR